MKPLDINQHPELVELKLGCEPRMQTLLLLSFTQTVRDPRVQRQIQALSHEYRLVTCGYGPAPDGVAQHLEISSDKLARPAGWLGLAALALRVHGLAARRTPAARAAERALKDVNFDLVLANDVAVVPIASKIAAGRPLIVDLYEFALDESTDWRWKLLVRPFNAYICKKYVASAGAVTTVAPGIISEYQRRFNFSPSLVLNAPLFRNPQIKLMDEPLRLVHHGAAIRDRVLEHMILGVGNAMNVTLDLYLVGMPHDPTYLEELTALAEDFSNVSIHPPVAFSEIPVMLSDYDLGLFVLPPTCFNYLHALPNKFFEFVQSGLPVIVGPSPEMAVLVKKYQIGLVLHDWEAESLRDGLDSLSLKEVENWQMNVCSAAKDLNGEGSMAVVRDLVRHQLDRAQ